MYICNECGYKSNKWLGKCPECNSWNSFSEIAVKKSNSVEKISAKNLKEIDVKDNFRFISNIEELDRTLGGGLTKGSVVLFTGDPGIGKSTLLLQAMFSYSNNHKSLYVSGEESEEQVASRAARITNNDKLEIVSNNNIDAILNASIGKEIVAIDSIQTMVSSELGSIPGSMSQIRECISKIISFAKENNISFIVVGHVNKDGKVAGPKMLEHMVDTLIELEGDRDLQYRILRATKNRFGSLNEVGVFKMLSSGMEEVKNPSELFISNDESVPGSIISPIIEGNRVFLVEIQSLVSFATFGVPRRIVQGIDSSQAQLISAICEKYLKLDLSSKDIFFNLPGGIRTKDPSIGLAVALSILSSYKDVDIKYAAIGEIGLTGEVRKVSFIDKRIKELRRLGFKKIIIPAACNYKENDKDIISIKNIKEIIGLI